MRDSSENVTRLLTKLSAGDKDVFDQIVTILHEELLVMASRIMRKERKEHILETRALVDEAYLKLIPADHGRWKTRGNFLMAAAQAMRCILIDYARKDRAGKRGGKAAIRSLDAVDSREFAIMDNGHLSREFEVVNRSLENFASNGYHKNSNVVQLHYLLQMNHKEIAEALNLSTKTIQRDLKFSLAWLNREIKRIVDDEQ